MGADPEGTKVMADQAMEEEKRKGKCFYWDGMKKIIKGEPPRHELNM